MMRQTFSKALMATLGIGTLLFAAESASAQNRVVLRSDDFREVMLTAAYATAYGAAGGAALLAFVPGSPVDNLRFVAGGASVGFLLGSALGFYNATQVAANQQDPFPPEDRYSYDSETTSDQSAIQSAPTCSGSRVPSLLMGCSDSFAVAVPAVAYAPGRVVVPVLDWKF